MGLLTMMDLPIQPETVVRVAVHPEVPDLRVEVLLLFLLLAAVAAGCWLLRYVSWVTGQPPFVRLLLLGLFQSCLFAPLAHRFVLPMFRKSVS